MTGELIRALVTSFVGTLGFAALLHAPRRAWLPASLIGGVGYLLYFALMQLGLSDPTSIFVGSLLASLLAQLAARKMRMIATIFVTLSIISFVPGLGLYRCMALLAEGQSDLGLKAGVAAMTSIVMIALGLGVGSFLFRSVAGAAKH